MGGAKFPTACVLKNESTTLDNDLFIESKSMNVMGHPITSILYFIGGISQNLLVKFYQYDLYLRYVLIEKNR